MHERITQATFESLNSGQQLRQKEMNSFILDGVFLAFRTIFYDVRLKNCHFKNIDFGVLFSDNCLIENCIFEKVDFRSSALVSVKFINSRFVNCDFRGLDFKTGQFENVIFNKCKIIDIQIEPANLKNVTYTGKLLDVRFIAKRPQTKLLVDLSNCKLDFVSFENCDLTPTKLPQDKNYFYISDMKTRGQRALDELAYAPESEVKKVLTRRLKKFSQQNQYIFNIKNFIEIEGQDVAIEFFKLLGYTIEKV